MQGYRLTHMLTRRPGPLSGFSGGLRSSSNTRPASLAPAAGVGVPVTVTTATPTSTTSIPSRPSLPSHQAQLPSGAASFSTTQPSLAKKSKKSKNNSPETSTSEDTSSKPEAEEEDPASGSGHPAADPDNLNDFPDLESRFQRAGERFSELIRKLRSGQTSMAVEEISFVRVRPDKATSATYPLRELATVVPRSGRLVSILVHEASFVKPIMSAVQNSPQFNQQPQRSEENELELTMKIARESPQEVAARVRDAAHAYKEAVRQARQKREKTHQRWLKEGVWLPDVKFKADKELQKKVERKNSEIERLEAQTMKNISSMREE